MSEDPRLANVKAVLRRLQRLSHSEMAPLPAEQYPPARDASTPAAFHPVQVDVLKAQASPEGVRPVELKPLAPERQQAGIIRWVPPFGRHALASTLALGMMIAALVVLARMWPTDGVAIQHDYDASPQSAGPSHASSNRSVAPITAETPPAAPASRSTTIQSADQARGQRPAPAQQTPPTPPSQTTQPGETHQASPPKPIPDTRAALTKVLNSAANAMTAGNVTAARDMLLGWDGKPSAEVAWALARSYDPNFLRTIQGGSELADPSKAERWYRVWHRLAVEQGLIAESVSVEPLIRALRAPSTTSE